MKQSRTTLKILILLLASALSTLFVASWARVNIVDLRSLTKFYNEQEIATVSSNNEVIEFNLNNVCDFLDSPRNVLRIAIRGYIEPNDDDVIILSLTDQENGLRIIMNESRQPIIYFQNPLSNPNAKGYELAPPLNEFDSVSVGNTIEQLNLDMTISIFFVSVAADYVTIQTEVRIPYEYSRLDNVVTHIEHSAFCASRGFVGIGNVENYLTVDFTSTKASPKNLEVSRNLRTHGLVSIMLISTLLVFGKLLETKWKTKE